MPNRVQRTCDKTVVVLMVLVQGYWQPGEVTIFGQQIGIERLVGIAVFLAVTVASVRLTAPALREANGFAWGAILEVAKLFAAIFVTMAPVLAIPMVPVDADDNESPTAAP